MKNKIQSTVFGAKIVLAYHDNTISDSINQTWFVIDNAMNKVAMITIKEVEGHGESVDFKREPLPVDYFTREESQKLDELERGFREHPKNLIIDAITTNAFIGVRQNKLITVSCE